MAGRIIFITGISGSRIEASLKEYEATYKNCEVIRLEKKLLEDSDMSRYLKTLVDIDLGDQ